LMKANDKAGVNKKNVRENRARGADLPPLRSASDNVQQTARPRARRGAFVAQDNSEGTDDRPRRAPSRPRGDHPRAHRAGGSEALSTVDLPQTLQPVW
jgi:hypothetical protein